MTYANPAERTALISGLRGLADYLESNPEVPAPIHSDMLTFPPKGEWTEMRAEIDVIAALLGVTAGEPYGEHYVASRYFGPVEYRAVAIPPKSSADRESE